MSNSVFPFLLKLRIFFFLMLPNFMFKTDFRSQWPVKNLHVSAIDYNSRRNVFIEKWKPLLDSKLL